jgi:hypothetical protein
LATDDIDEQENAKPGGTEDVEAGEDGQCDEHRKKCNVQRGEERPVFLCFDSNLHKGILGAKTNWLVSALIPH